jgi:hypothetical protein
MGPATHADPGTVLPGHAEPSPLSRSPQLSNVRSAWCFALNLVHDSDPWCHIPPYFNNPIAKSRSIDTLVSQDQTRTDTHQARRKHLHRPHPALSIPQLQILSVHDLQRRSAERHILNLAWNILPSNVGDHLTSSVQHVNIHSQPHILSHVHHWPGHRPVHMHVQQGTEDGPTLHHTTACSPKMSNSPPPPTCIDLAPCNSDLSSTV